MPLTITYIDGPMQDTSIEFGDDVEQVLLGRDPERCQVVLPPDQTMVGREHCSIIRSSRFIGKFVTTRKKFCCTICFGKII